MAPFLVSRGLIPPNSQNLGQVGAVIDIVILFFTIIGASIILVGLVLKEFRTRTSTVRTRLLMMLVFSDLFMGIVGIISPLIYVITDGPGGPQGGLCDALAFLLLASFWSQYFVAMLLTICTYCILLHPLSRITRLIQEHYLWFFPVVWALSFVFSGVAWHVATFSFSGGFCYIGTEGPRFFGDMFAFIPRSIVAIVVVGLTAHLIHFLRRPDRLQTAGTDEIRSHGNSSPWWGRGQLGRRVGLERSRQGSSQTEPTESASRTRQGSLAHLAAIQAHSQRQQRKSDTTAVDPKAPWEAIDIEMPSNIPDFVFEPPSRRASEMTAASRNQPTTPPSGYEVEARLSGAEPAGLKPEDEPRSDFQEFERSSDELFAKRSPVANRPASPSSVSGHSSFSVSTVDSLSAPPLRPTPKRQRSHPAIAGSRKMSLKDILDAETSITLPPLGRADGSGTGSQTASQIRRNSEGVVLNEESLSSYMNRKASLLMILFPLAYVALFSVSLARIVVDFVIERPVPWLSGLSRFFIFSQGIVDLLLYGLVEWRVRRGVQRKLHAGHFDSRASQS